MSSLKKPIVNRYDRSRTVLEQSGSLIMFKYAPYIIIMDESEYEGEEDYFQFAVRVIWGTLGESNQNLQRFGSGVEKAFNLFDPKEVEEAKEYWESLKK